MKVVFWMLLGLVAASSLWIWVSSGTSASPEEKYSEEEYIEYTLDKLGYPSSVSAGSSFIPADGQVYTPIKNFFAMQGENTFGVFSNGKFNGFHTGVDIEIGPDDLDKDVPVYSIYSGTVISVESASGYGGVVVIRHRFGDLQYAVIYGHLRLKDIKVSRGQKVGPGEIIGYLGASYSAETDGERKHLHFGINKAGEKNILGYIDSRDTLNKSWLDPTTFLRGVGAREVPD